MPLSKQSGFCLTIAMTGAGEGATFIPHKIEVLDIAVAGVVADDARIPQGL